ncbi:MAG TPA: alkaline phosphatase family protein [bacterium]|nr:alkaline phosphatase family protein [bacterium]
MSERLKVIIIVVDALKRDVFYNMLEDGELPGLAEAFNDGAFVRYGTTIYPTETFPAQTSIFTGLEVRHHGIVGNGWMDRTGGSPQIVDLHSIDTAANVYGYKLFGWPTMLLPLRDNVGLINREMYPEAKTIYQRAAAAGLSSTVIFNQIGKGAGRWVRPSRLDMIYFALSTRGVVNFQRIDSQTYHYAEKELKKREQPDIFTLYLGGLDAWGHHTGNEGQSFYLKSAIDPCITSLLRQLDAGGTRDSTRLVLCSDHGQAWLRDVRMIDLKMLTEWLDVQDFDVFTGSAMQHEKNCYINLIGGCAQFYVKNRKSNSWNDAPDLEHDLMPLAESLHGICGKINEGLPPPEGGITSIILVRRSREDGYGVLYNGELVDPEKFFWEKLDRYPRAFNNIYGLNCSRSGDVVMLSNFEEGCYISEESYARSHGSLAMDDTSVPIVFSGPGIPHRVIERGSILDITPTVLSFFGIDATGTDGNVLKFD